MDWLSNNWHVIAGVLIPTLIAFAVGVAIGSQMDRT